MLMASLFAHLAFFTLIANLCYGFNPRLLNVSKLESGSDGWSSARASWYGNPSGAGSDGETIETLLSYTYHILI